MKTFFPFPSPLAFFTSLKKGDVGIVEYFFQAVLLKLGTRHEKARFPPPPLPPPIQFLPKIEDLLYPRFLLSLLVGLPFRGPRGMFAPAMNWVNAL